MATIINFGVAPPHDPMFGIRSENIVSRLTQKNWRKKATGRIRNGRFLYVMVKRGEQKIDGRKQKSYFVRVHLGEPTDQQLNADFDKLKDALAYVNGEGKTAMAIATAPAAPDEKPENRGTDFFITGFTGHGRERRQNFTIRLPGGLEDDCGED